MMDTDLVANQADKKTRSLVAAKDRGQLTQTAAMSLVNIGLLKEIINQGEKHRRFMVLLVLISVSLGLQIITGLLSLFISNVKTYYRRHNEDPTEDCCINLCNCSCTWKSESACACCKPICPWECSAYVYDQHEADIMKRSAESQKNVFDTKLSDLRSKGEAELLAKTVEYAHNEQDRLRILLEGPKANWEEINSRILALSDELADAQKRKQILEKEVSEADILKSQSEALINHAENIERNVVLKRITFWQNGVNYLYYIILVLNAFITGLGLSDQANLTIVD